MSVVIVIPARLASTRLPEKPLVEIKGKPMVQHVYERASQVRGISRVIVATDHERIYDVVRKFGGDALMTPTDLQSGTDRVAFVARQSQGDVFINLQGDEPLMDPVSVEKTLALVSAGRFSMATPAAPLKGREFLDNPNVVKVLVDAKDQAIYFSRFSIPYSRGPVPQDVQRLSPLHHLGLYVYTRETLLRFADLPRTELELAESLEQLRALYYGIPIGVARVDKISFGVDTAEDLELVRKLI